MRLPPSRTAWRMPAARRGSAGVGRARAVSSAASMRARQVSRSGPAETAPGASDIFGRAGERLGFVRLVRVAEQLHPQLGLLQRLLAAAVQANALLVGGQRLLQAQLAFLHVVDEGFQLFEGFLEVGDGGGVGGGVRKAVWWKNGRVRGLIRAIHGPHPSGAARLRGSLRLSRSAVLPICRTAPSARVQIQIPLSARYAKRPDRGVLRIWRRGGDSNPRGAINACLISSQVHSTTLPPLRWFAAAGAAQSAMIRARRAGHKARRGAAAGAFSGSMNRGKRRRLD